jgi:hypothetical protein
MTAQIEMWSFLNQGPKSFHLSQLALTLRIQAPRQFGAFND